MAVKETFIVESEIEYNKPASLPVIVLPTNFKGKRINLYGDSFADAPPVNHVLMRTWVYLLSQLLEVEIYGYGISGAAESTIKHVYEQTLNKERDYTIIFHTQPDRTDTFFELPDLDEKDYQHWESLIGNQPTLHLYWSEQAHYKFKNAESLTTDYWVHDIDKEIVNNHMSHKHNIQFAIDVYKILKEKNELVNE